MPLSLALGMPEGSGADRKQLTLQSNYEVAGDIVKPTGIRKPGGILLRRS